MNIWIYMHVNIYIYIYDNKDSEIVKYTITR